MRVNHRAARLTCILALLIASGCDSRDKRLVELAERSAERQKAQNEVIAWQSKAVTLENQRIAEAARELVAKDAEARQQMIQAQRELHTELQTERSSLDRQKEAMEQERRDIAERRGRDPIVAEAVRSMGTLLVCLVPLIVAAYALSRLDRGPGDGQQLSELLIHELAGDNPILLPYRRVPAIENDGDDPPEIAGNPPPVELPDPADFPF